MTWDFIFAQILGLIALVLVCFSYNTNIRKRFLFFQIIANIFYAASFLTLGVFVGGISTIISIFRVILLYICEKFNKKPSKVVFFMFSSFYLIFGIIFFENILDIIAIISYEIFNLAMFVRNINLVRILMVPPNIMIITYNILNLTFTNAILDFIEILVLIITIIKYRQKINKKIKFLL